MTAKLDIAGQQFGRLTAIESTGRSSNNGTIWRCCCSCGKEVEIGICSLQSGNTRSCGCLQDESRRIYCKDRLGKKYGKLIVIAKGQHTKDGVTWLCKCECGNEVTVLGRSLHAGLTRSCGCLRYKTQLKLKGKKFGKLIAIAYIKRGSQGNEKPGWLCRCACGNTLLKSTFALTSGRSRDCGCGCGRDKRRKPYVGKSARSVGKRFGWLKVLAITSKRTKNNVVLLECECKCGNVVMRTYNELTRKSKQTKTCGCRMRNGEAKKKEK